MALRLSPSDAAIRGIISKEEAANMERLARDRRNPVRISAQTGAALKPNQKPTEAAKALAAAVRAGNEIPQRRLFEELSLRLPGIPQWEREDLIPDRKFRADIFCRPISFSNSMVGLTTAAVKPLKRPPTVQSFYASRFQSVSRFHQAVSR